MNVSSSYVPWNLHEEHPGEFKFTDNLDLRSYLQIAKEEDLFVILRPSPFICSEWEFGGLPSWLLRYNDMKVRTSDPTYEQAVQNYYEQLIPLVTDLQFTYGGPIIAVQIENEYGSFETYDPDYLNFLKTLMENLGIVELFATSDSCEPDACRQYGSLPDVLMTSNFNSFPEAKLDQLQRLQPDRPLMVMEFWTGWFDHWGFAHSTVSVQDYTDCLTTILVRNSSLSMYMFHGGTSFGFMNGANMEAIYLADVTSYDYDSLITESGDYTEKYNVTKSLFAEYSAGHLWDVTLPDPPPVMEKAAYGEIQITDYLVLNDILNLVETQTSDAIIPMELLNLYKNSGQNFGYILYENTIDIAENGSSLKIVGRVRDNARVIIDNEIVAKIERSKENAIVDFTSSQGQKDLKILVENSGRVNFGLPIGFKPEQQCKGLYDPVEIDGTALNNWKIYPLEFNESFLNATKSASWRPFDSQVTYPAFLKATLTIDGDPKDTFVNMGKWTKGIVIVNDFVLGRHWNIGPQVSLYLPAPILQTGDNSVFVFELDNGSDTVLFEDHPNLGMAKP